MAVLGLLVLTLYYAGIPFVQQSLQLDLTGDGADELILVVWKYGSYGKHHPSWVTVDDAGLTQHVFIYEKRSDEKWHPIWMSSRTGLGIRRMKAGPEIRGTGRPRLIFTSDDGTVTEWGWLTWGLTRVD